MNPFRRLPRAKPWRVFALLAFTAVIASALVFSLTGGTARHEAEGVKAASAVSNTLIGFMGLLSPVRKAPTA